MLGLIALAMLAMFGIYVIRGPVDYLIAGGLLFSFVACLVPLVYMLKPRVSREEFLRHKAEQARKKEATGGPEGLKGPKDPEDPEGPGS